VVEGTVDFSSVASPEPETDWAREATVTSSGGKNHAPGKPIDGFPEAATDGNLESSWRHMAEDQDPEGWLELDFGQVLPVGRIRHLRRQTGDWRRQGLVRAPPDVSCANGRSYRK
jgi:hypothetical protein